MLNLPSLRSDGRGVSSINGRQFYVLKLKKKNSWFFLFWGGGLNDCIFLELMVNYVNEKRANKDI